MTNGADIDGTTAFWFALPREITFLDELPKTGTGKIDRQALLKTLTESAMA